MGRPRFGTGLAESSVRFYRKVRQRQLRPGSIIAAALIGAGMKQRDAAEAVGLHEGYLSVVKAHNPQFRAEMEATTEAILEEIQDPREALEKLLLPAVKHTARLMHNAKSEDTQLKAASSILDRGGLERASKIKTFGISIQGKDADRLAEALLQSAAVSREFAAHAEGYEAVEAQVERTVAIGGASGEASAANNGRGVEEAAKAE